MKKILTSFFLLALICLAGISASAQTVKLVPTVTLSPNDTAIMSGTATMTFDRTITANYNWSVSCFWDHVTGTTDSCYCYIQESVDGTNYKTVVGAVTAAFGVNDATYIWSGGTGNLPLVWAPNYLRVSCSHKNTGTGRPTIKLQLKNK